MTDAHRTKDPLVERLRYELHCLDKYGRQWAVISEAADAIERLAEELKAQTEVSVNYAMEIADLRQLKRKAEETLRDSIAAGAEVVAERDRLRAALANEKKNSKDRAADDDRNQTFLEDECARLRAALERIAADSALANKEIESTYDAGLLAGHSICKHIARAALAGGKHED